VHGTSAVVGVGESTYYRAGRSPHSSVQLAAVAVARAVADAGLRPRDVDGLVTYFDRRNSWQLATLLGLGDLRFAVQAWGGGQVGAAAMLAADAAVTSGYARRVVVVRAICQGREGRLGRAPDADEAEGEAAFLAPFGAGQPVVRNALLVRAYMEAHGVTQRALMEVALASYAHAQRNPRALMHGRPLTPEAYEASRVIASPFHLYDCCQESDGAAAVVVTSGDAAADLHPRPAYLLAGASGMEHGGGQWAFNDTAFPDGRYRSVAAQLWSRAGVGPGDVDVAQCYENFTGTTLMAMSDLGFAPPEGIEEFVADGGIRWPSGRLPVNTSGGNLAEAYIHGFQLMNEAVRQVRGTSTCQVDDVDLSLYVAGPGTPPGSALLLTPHRA
jgi:acetyl-CoA acetyltransferase